MLEVATFDTFCQGFELDILHVIQDAHWDEHHQKIKALKIFAHSVDVDDLDDHQCQDLAYLLGHAAWAVSAKLQKQDRGEAFQLLMLADTFIKDPFVEWLLKGYLQYVESTVCRGYEQFEEAIYFAQGAYAAFGIAESNRASELRQHTLNQLSLALIRNGRFIVAGDCLFERMDSLNGLPKRVLKKNDKAHFNASDLIAIAEASTALRINKNKTRWYLEVKRPEYALQYISKVVDSFDPFKRPLDRASNLTLRAACFSLQNRSSEAYADLKAAFGIYQNCFSEPHIDALIALIDLAKASADAGRPNVKYLKEAYAMQVPLGLKETHHLMQALNAVPEKGTMADEHYRLASDLLARNRLVLFTSHQCVGYQASALFYPLCFIFKALLSVARALNAAVLGCSKEINIEMGAAFLNVLNAVASLLVLVSRTLATVFNLSYLDSKLNLDKMKLEEKISVFERQQLEAEAYQNTMALGA